VVVVVVVVVVGLASVRVLRAYEDLKWVMYLVGALP
jgi:hypothetical protein